jgi:hypothetical protein
MRPSSSKEFPFLATARLRLRQPAPEDAAAFRALLSIPGISRFSNWPDAPTKAQSERYARWMAKLYASGKGCAWIIEDNTSGSLIGAIRFNQFDRRWRPRGRRARPQYARPQPHRGLDPARQHGLGPRARKGGLPLRGHLAGAGVVQGRLPRLPHVRPTRQRPDSIDAAPGSLREGHASGQNCGNRAEAGACGARRAL